MRIVIGLMVAVFGFTALGLDLPINVDEWILHTPEPRKQSVKVVPGPENKEMFEFKVVPKSFKYFEFRLKKNVLLGNSPDEVNHELEFDLKVTPASAMQFMSARVVDATGEVFQIRFPMKPVLNEWIDMKIKLTPENLLTGGSWGGNKDKKLDYPLYFVGVTADFAGNFDDVIVQIKDIELDD